MAQFDFDETIAAPASAPGASLRGTLRVSGANVQQQLLELFNPDDEHRWRDAKQPMIHSGQLAVAADLRLNVTIGLWPTARSYTGQPMAEIYTLGSQPLIEQILSRLNSTGIRTARNGEFTLRAFLNGRIDLIQAEAVLGVIDSQSESELQLALNQLGGGMSKEMLEVRQDLVELLADLEAGLDFVDEDIEFVAHEEVSRRLDDARESIGRLRELSNTRLRSETRTRVVLAGLPNAGKSTLLNQLAGEETALVSEISGTTRDYVAAECQIHGLPVLIIDTAGWELSDDPIMQTAQQFREEQIQRADLVIWCSAFGLTEEKTRSDQQQSQVCRTQARQMILLGTKADLVDHSNSQVTFDSVISVIESECAGIDELMALISQRLDQQVERTEGLIGTTSARCRETLRETEDAMANAIDAAEQRAGDELIALELRSALDGLGQVLGLLHSDDILDRIFSKFCIGK
jgi:tRNA modification GTPase